MIKSALQSSLTSDVRYTSMSAGATPSSEYLIETTVVGAGGVASVTFSNLGQYAGVYQHLQIRYSARVSGGSIGATVFWMQVNDDMGSNYRGHVLRGTGSSVVSGSVSQSATVDVATTGGGAITAGAFSAGVIELLDPFETTKNKVSRSLSGVTGQVELRSWLWLSTSAITSIKLSPFASDGSWVEHSRFSLYGVTA